MRQFNHHPQSLAFKFQSKVLGGILIFILLSWVTTAYGAGGEPLEDPIPTPIPRGQIQIRLETVAEGLTAPNWGTSAPGDETRLFVTDQNGILWAIDLQTGEKSVFLDVRNRLVPLGAFGQFDERGLLGVAFHPDYATNGLLYTYTSEPVDGPADFSTIPAGATANHQSVILEWQVPNPTDPASVVDPESARELMRIDQPQFNHDGGALEFGPDGMLYIALGDGGGADDVDGQNFLGTPIIGHGEGNGQDPSNVLGTILRIDPTGSDSANGQYGIPADNPFVGQSGFVDEIYAYGLRNPYRFSIDTLTGDMYIADVGQNDIEEVDLGVSGANYGWNLKEGSFCFDPNGNAAGFVTACEPGQVPEDLVDPIAEYDHDEGTAIIGGFVYRGESIPALSGRYVFGDWARTFLGNNGRLFYLDENNQIAEFRLYGQAEFGLALGGFGQDAQGEVYVLANATGTPFGNTGVVLRIAPPPPPGTDSLTARVFIDYRCDRFFQRGMDQPIPGASVTAEFSNGLRITRSTTALGVVNFPNFDAAGGVTVSVELPESYRGFALGWCANSRPSVQLQADDFQFGYKFLQFGADIVGEIAGP